MWFSGNISILVYQYIISIYSNWQSLARVDLSVVIWVFPKMVVPQNTPKWPFLAGKPMVVGETHHFRKPPYGLSGVFHRSKNIILESSTSTVPTSLSAVQQVISAVQRARGVLRRSLRGTSWSERCLWGDAKLPVSFWQLALWRIRDILQIDIADIVWRWIDS